MSHQNVPVGNERVRAALATAGMSPADLAGDLGVDPKTVERWVNPGRVPHRRTAQKAASALGRLPEELWPEFAEPVRLGYSDLVTTYPDRASVPRETWLKLLTEATEQIDVLVFSGTFFAQTNPRVAAMLTGRAAAGVRVRLCFGDPNSEATAIRGREEGIHETLAAKVRASLTYYRSLLDQPGCEVRLHGKTLYASLFRYDSTLIANPHIFGQPASANPALHLRRRQTGGYFDRYAESFEAVWQTAVLWEPAIERPAG